MIARYVFFRLNAEHSNDPGRAAVVDAIAALAGEPTLRAVVVGVPADSSAEGSWDVAASFSFDTLEAVASFLEAPAVRRLHEEFLAPRTVVMKAWNFSC